MYHYFYHKLFISYFYLIFLYNWYFIIKFPIINFHKNVVQNLIYDF